MTTRRPVTIDEPLTAGGDWDQVEENRYRSETVRQMRGLLDAGEWSSREVIIRAPAAEITVVSALESPDRVRVTLVKRRLPPDGLPAGAAVGTRRLPLYNTTIAGSSVTVSMYGSDWLPSGERAEDWEALIVISEDAG